MRSAVTVALAIAMIATVGCDSDPTDGQTGTTATVSANSTVAKRLLEALSNFQAVLADADPGVSLTRLVKAQVEQHPEEVISVAAQQGVSREETLQSLARFHPPGQIVAIERKTTADTVLATPTSDGDLLCADAQHTEPYVCFHSSG